MVEDILQAEIAEAVAAVRSGSVHNFQQVGAIIARSRVDSLRNYRDIRHQLIVTLKIVRILGNLAGEFTGRTEDFARLLGVIDSVEAEQHDLEARLVARLTPSDLPLYGPGILTWLRDHGPCPLDRLSIEFSGVDQILEGLRRLLLVTETDGVWAIEPYAVPLTEPARA